MEVANKVCAVIIAAYNADRWILDCLRSVANQDPTPGWTYEIRIGVDGCERTAAFLESQGIPHYRSRENVGAYVIRNSLIAIRPADAYAIVDADDVLLPNYLSSLLADSEGCRIAGPARIQVDENLKPISSPMLFSGGVCLLPHSAWERLGGYRPERIASDSDLVERAKLLGIPVRPHPRPLYLRRRHASSLTQASETGIRSAARAAVRETHRQLREQGELKVDPQTVELEPFGDFSQFPALPQLEILKAREIVQISWKPKMKESPPKAIYVAWNRKIWGPGMPGRSLEDLERAKAEHFRQTRGASSPAPSLTGAGNETAAKSADTMDTIEVVRKHACWYDVVRNGVVVNEKGLRKEDAEALAEQLRHGGTA